MAKYKLEDICEFITDGTHQTPEYCENGGVMFLSSKDVTDRRINWDKVKYIPDALHEKLYKRLSPKKNDILLAKNGTTGVAAIVDRNVVFDVYVSLAVLRPLETIYPKYLLYAINSPVAKRQFDAGLKGIGVPNLHLGVIRNTIINIVSWEEQEKICKILDKVTILIDERKKELQLLDDLIKARFVEMFGDCKKLVSLGDLCLIITDGTHQPPKFQDRGIPFILVSNLSKNTVTYNTEKYINEETYNELYKRTPIETGDVLLSTVGSYGHPAVVVEDKKFLFQRHIAYLKPKRDIINSFYLHSALLSPNGQHQIEEKVKGIAQKTLNLSEIKKIMIPLPSLDEQNEFEAFVKQIDKSKVAILKNYSQGGVLSYDNQF